MNSVKEKPENVTPWWLLHYQNHQCLHKVMVMPRLCSECPLPHYIVHIPPPTIWSNTYSPQASENSHSLAHSSPIISIIKSCCMNLSEETQPHPPLQAVLAPYPTCNYLTCMSSSLGQSRVYRGNPCRHRGSMQGPQRKSHSQLHGGRTPRPSGWPINGRKLWKEEDPYLNLFQHTKYEAGVKDWKQEEAASPAS